MTTVARDFFQLLIPGAVALAFIQLSTGIGQCQGQSNDHTLPVGSSDTARAWVEAGRVVDKANPIWNELQSEMAQGFGRALNDGLAALTNDLAGARRQFSLAAREAEQLGRGEQAQARLGLDYVDALTALQQAKSPGVFTSCWARVQDAEEALPASWPRVGTNVAVRVVRNRVDATLDDVPRGLKAYNSPHGLLDAIEALEIVSAVQRDNPRGLQDPIQNREARNLSAPEAASYGPSYLQWLGGVERQLKANHPQEYEKHRKDIDRVRSRLTRF